MTLIYQMSIKQYRTLDWRLAASSQKLLDLG